jgi:hypothetical protein
MVGVRIIKLLALAGVVCLMGCRGYCERNYPAVSGQANCGCAPVAQQPCCTPAGYTPVQATPCVVPQQGAWNTPVH